MSEVAPEPLATFAGRECVADSVWLRVDMLRLDPSVRAGWKLHVSTTPDKLGALADALAPVRCPLKIAASVDVAENLNDGAFGLSQVGKIATLYPVTEARLLEVAKLLHPLLHEHKGPAITHDTRLFPDAPFYYRFGPYDGRFQIDGLGRMRRLLAHPELGDVIDVTDGGTASLPVPKLLPTGEVEDHLAFLRRRYFFVRMEQVSARGAVLVALDSEAPSRGPLLVKTSRRGACSDRHGRDAMWAARHEYAMFQKLQGIDGIPEAGELIEGAGVIAQVRPYHDGDTFWHYWTQPNARTDAGRAHLLRMVEDVRQIAEAAHARGIVLRDISPGNVLWAEGRTWFVDLELTREEGDETLPYRRGTWGFYDPAGEEPGEEGDVYALRALETLARDGVHAGWWPGGLREAEERVCASRSAEAQRDSLEIATSLEDSLLAMSDAGADAANVYHGTAGIYLLLAEMGRDGELNEPVGERLAVQWREAAREVAHIPGLYFGCGGMALALALLGKEKNCWEWVDAAHEIMAGALDCKWIPDVTHGMAGLLLAALTAQRETGDQRFALLSEKAAKKLIVLGREREGIWCWPWPEGEEFGGLSGTSGFGFAHGTAGITYALLRYWIAFKDKAALDAARRGVASLRKSALPLDGEREDVWWPVSNEDATCWNAWCHGTPGVVKTLALAAVLGELEDSKQLIPAALRGMIAGNSAQPGLCHGAASRVDAFVDARAFATAEVDEAIAFDARVLEALDLARLDGVPGLQDARGLMTGGAGILRTLLRYRSKLENVQMLLP